MDTTGIDSRVVPDRSSCSTEQQTSARMRHWLHTFRYIFLKNLSTALQCTTNVKTKPNSAYFLIKNNNNDTKY